MTTHETDWRPLEEHEHESQLRALQSLLAPAPKRILDLGAGDGRIAEPLIRAGHTVLAIDSDPCAIDACAARNIPARRADLLDPAANLAFEGAPADAAIMLGHTFMLFDNPIEAARLMRRIHQALAPGAPLILDNFPAELWRDVHEGAWTEGVSEAGDQQILWREGENVFALREGDDVDEDDWTIRPTDCLHRLWSMGELALLAMQSAFSGPRPDPSGLLLVFRTL